MTELLNATGKIRTAEDGKKWLPVDISFEALRQINKVVLGDVVDSDDKKAVASRRQIHDDILELMELFHS